MGKVLGATCGGVNARLARRARARVSVQARGKVFGVGGRVR